MGARNDGLRRIPSVRRCERPLNRHYHESQENNVWYFIRQEHVVGAELVSARNTGRHEVCPYSVPQSFAG